jgi:hypothetical protein
MNELAYTELILSIDDKTGEGQTEIREQRVKRRKHHFRRIIIR